MPHTKPKQKKRATAPAALPPLSFQRTGMPAQDSIVSVHEPKKGKKSYRFIVTNEVDEYEQTPKKTRRKSR
jgi:hypothetical protein